MTEHEFMTLIVSFMQIVTFSKVMWRHLGTRSENYSYLVRLIFITKNVSQYSFQFENKNNLNIRRFQFIIFISFFFQSKINAGKRNGREFSALLQ